MNKKSVEPHFLVGMIVKMNNADILKSLTWSKNERVNSGHVFPESTANYLANKYAMIAEISDATHYALYFPDDNYTRKGYPSESFELVTDLLTEYRR